MSPRDLVRVNGEFYEITGIHLGAVGQVGVATLRSVRRLAPVAYGQVVDEMHVPVDLLEAYTARVEGCYFVPSAPWKAQK